jgi:hypothetical protein
MEQGGGGGGGGVIIHATSDLLKLAMRFSIQAIIMIVSDLQFHYVHCNLS